MIKVSADRRYVRGTTGTWYNLDDVTTFMVGQAEDATWYIDGLGDTCSFQAGHSYFNNVLAQKALDDFMEGR